MRGPVVGANMFLGRRGGRVGRAALGVLGRLAEMGQGEESWPSRGLPFSFFFLFFFLSYFQFPISSFKFKLSFGFPIQLNAHPKLQHEMHKLNLFSLSLSLFKYLLKETMFHK